MIKEEDFILLSIKCGYDVFISSKYMDSSFFTKNKATFFYTINNKISCYIASGMALSGVKVVVLLDKAPYSFFDVRHFFCDDYKINFICFLDNWVFPDKYFYSSLFNNELGFIDSLKKSEIERSPLFVIGSSEL